MEGASLVCSVDNTDLGGLEVADLADHDDVGILAQKCRSAAAKFSPIFLVHLHLVDAAEVELDRILGRGDVGRWAGC